MLFNDKHGVLKNLGSRGDVVLELGCGNRKKISAAIGIDALDYDCVDIVGDVFDVLKAFPAQSVAEVHSSHFFEHVENLGSLLDEIARILKPGGQLEVVVPHFSNPYFYSDPTHRKFFGLYTFSYFAEDSILCRRVPTYQREITFALSHVELGFGSLQPFYVRHVLKKLFGLLVNLTTYTKEFYEENLCYLFPCYEIRFRLVRTGH